MLSVAVFAFLAVCYIYFRVQRWELVKYAGEIPGFDTLPVVGNYHYFLRIKTLTDAWNILQGMMDRYTEHGLLRIWYGPVLVVALWDPSYIEVVATSPYTVNKGIIYYLLFGYILNGVFTVSGGPLWKELKKPFTKSLTKKYLQRDCFEIFIRRTKEYKDFVIKYREGKSTDVKEDMSALLMDIYSETHIGVHLNEVQERRWNFSEMVEE